MTEEEVFNAPRSVAIALTIILGLVVDQLVLFWGHIVVSVWVWGYIGYLVWRGDKRLRVTLAILIPLAWIGEFWLSDLWGLYTYRDHFVPLFVPPGHALLYLLGVEIAKLLSDRKATLVPIIATPWIIWSIVSGIDTQVIVWFSFFILFMIFGKARRLYATMFVIALLMELWGTWLGNWAWAPVVPILNLTSTNPPSSAGVFYCFLDLLVINITGFFLAKSTKSESTSDLS